jgi:hypothetical protein
MSCSECGTRMKSKFWRKKWAHMLDRWNNALYSVSRVKSQRKGWIRAPCHVGARCTIEILEKKTPFGNNLQITKEKFQQESGPKPKSQVAASRKSWPRRNLQFHPWNYATTVQRSLDFSCQHNTQAQLERNGDIFWSGVSKMPVRVRNNANKEVFHGKQLTAFLRRHPLTAVLYLPNRSSVRRWKLEDGKGLKLSRGEDGLNLPCGHQREREGEEDKQSRPITGAKTCTEASWPHGCPRSTVNRLDMAEKQVVAVATTSSSDSEPSGQRGPAACPSSPTPNPIQWSSGAEHGLLCRLTRPASRPRP